MEWDAPVLDHLVAVGFDEKLGARPMKRAIETEVLAPLARLLALGVEPGTVFVASVVDGRIQLLRGGSRAPR